MLAIKNNIMASNAARHLGRAYDGLATSVERLSSGLRINSAKDDAAGLAVRELIRADVAVLQQGSRNASDAISMLQTMEGAMAVIDDNLIRMKELAEQAATGSYSSAQRDIMNNEFAEMASEVERIAGATAFNGIEMLNKDSNGDNDTNPVTIHIGTSTTISVDRQDMTIGSAGLNITTGTAGWSTTQDIDNAALVTSLTDTTFFTVKDAADDTATFTLTFTGASTNEAAITWTMCAANAAATGYSITDVRDAINTTSQNLAKKADGTVQAYAAAEVVRNANGNYQLKLNSRTADATGLDLVISDDWSSAAATLTGWMVTSHMAAGATASLEAATIWNTAAGDAGSGINVTTAAAALTALDRVTTAINTKDAARAAFGYKMNRLESSISILDIQAENLMAAESRISDVDVATEMATLTRTQVLSQAGIAMLAQANAMPQMALSLLR